MATSDVGTKVDTVTHWIEGRAWTGPVERWGDVFDPATGEKQRRVAFATAAVVDAAVGAAKRSSRATGPTSPRS
jgi:malonate-semialdehyde dehydrogenase (acetylating)/methylmalonate-semialdehyde dehydrogenase